jgi:TolA-binding protein
MQHVKFCLYFCGTFLLLTATGCDKKSPPPVPPVPVTATNSVTAKELFERTLTDYHLASANLAEPKRTELLKKADEGYRKVLHDYPADALWAAQAQRSLGNVQAELGQWEEAVKSYAQVEKTYPKQEWEVVQSWKSAADLLWDKDQKEKAKEYYRKIVTTYEGKDVGAVFGIIVKASKKRLE